MLPYFYIHFSWVLCDCQQQWVRWDLQLRASDDSALGAGHADSLAWGAFLDGEGGLSKALPCSFLTCPQRTGFLLDTQWQVQNVSKRDLAWFNISQDGQHILYGKYLTTDLLPCKTGIFWKRGKRQDQKLIFVPRLLLLQMFAAGAFHFSFSVVT